MIVRKVKTMELKNQMSMILKYEVLGRLSLVWEKRVERTSRVVRDTMTLFWKSNHLKKNVAKEMMLMRVVGMNTVTICRKEGGNGVTD